MKIAGGVRLQALILGQGPLAGMFGLSSAVPGGTGGLMGSLFGGARAAGGPVEPRKAYLVGERGPEIVIPKSPGVVIPNGAFGGSQSVSQSNTFNIKVEGSAGTPEQNDDLVRKMSAALEQKVNMMATNAIRQQTRPGGMLR